MNYLIYQSYGSKDILNECIYSILSLMKTNTIDSLPAIVVYTDQPSYFDLFQTNTITIVEINQATIKKYKGPNDFIHRVKIEILLDCCDKFSGNIMYVDSDTYFLDSTKELFQTISHNSFLMHTKEGVIGNRISITFNRFANFIKHKRNFLKNNNIKLSEQSVMWNAGVLGFHSSQIEVLKETLFVTDSIYALFTSHVVEQMAFSYCFQKYGNIIESKERIFHYWNFKEFRTVLDEFFINHKKNQSTLSEIIADIDSIRPDRLIQPKMEYEALPFIQKTLRKIKGKKNRWRFPHYTFTSRLSAGETLEQ